MRWVLGALALSACTHEGAPEQVVLDADVRSWINDVTTVGGTLTGQVVAPTSDNLQLAPPVSTGLTFEPLGDARVEQAGSSTVMTQQWSFAGQKGNYRIDGPAAMWGEDGQAIAPSLFVDMGVGAPREGTLADITDPTQVDPFPLVAVAVGSGVALLFIAGVWFAMRARPSDIPKVVVPPDVAALRAWATVQRDPTLNDHDRALAISGIFRTYAEAALAFPATSGTSSEILRYLGGLQHLSAENLPRAKQLLRATDRVKFADEAATEELFERLGTDLEDFVESTRPRRRSAGD
ncbi:MAG: hypothetical protein ACJAZO_002584 [Myxococcota bacterium]|jgi:hypothetical protein